MFCVFSGFVLLFYFVSEGETTCIYAFIYLRDVYNISPWLQHTVFTIFLCFIRLCQFDSFFYFFIIRININLSWIFNFKYICIIRYMYIYVYILYHGGKKRNKKKNNLDYFKGI